MCVTPLLEAPNEMPRCIWPWWNSSTTRTKKHTDQGNSKLDIHPSRTRFALLWNSLRNADDESREASNGFPDRKPPMKFDWSLRTRWQTFFNHYLRYPTLIYWGKFRCIFKKESVQIYTNISNLSNVISRGRYLIFYNEFVY